MAQPITKPDGSLKLADLNIQKDMGDLFRRWKKPGHKLRPYDQRQAYFKQPAGSLKSTKSTLTGQSDPTAVTEKSADGALGEFSIRKSISTRKYICLPCKNEKLIVRNPLSCQTLP